MDCQEGAVTIGSLHLFVFDKILAKEKRATMYATRWFSWTQNKYSTSRQIVSGTFQNCSLHFLVG